MSEIQTRYEAARNALARNDVNSAEAEWTEIVKLATPKTAKPGEALIPDGVDADLARRAAMNLGLMAENRAQVGLQKLIADQNAGVVLTPGAPDVLTTIGNIARAKRMLYVGTHDGNDRPLADAGTVDNAGALRHDGFLKLAVADLQTAQALTVVPVFAGAHVALANGRLNVDQLPSIQALKRADEAITQARQNGANTADADKLQQIVKLQGITITAAVYAGAIAALSPATNTGSINVRGAPVTGATLMKVINVGEYARLVRSSLPIKENSAEAMNAWLGMPSEAWKGKVLQLWGTAMYPEVQNGTPAVKAVVTAATNMLGATAEAVR